MVRFAISLVISGIGLAVFVVLLRRPKPEQPPTWAMSMLGAFGVWFMFMMGYGVVPHEWLTWGDSDLGLREDKILLDTYAIDISGRTLRDVVATVIYLVVMGINMATWSMWQKRGTAKPKKAAAAPVPVPAGTSAFDRPVTKKD